MDVLRGLIFVLDPIQNEVRLIYGLILRVFGFGVDQDR